MISLRALVSHKLAPYKGIFVVFVSFPFSSTKLAGNAISWWNMLLSMDNTNTYRFGIMELALPQNWTLPFSKIPWATKG